MSRRLRIFSVSDLHVIPLGDLREHEASSECWCNPQDSASEPGIWVHSALDGREAYETGSKLLN